MLCAIFEIQRQNLLFHILFSYRSRQTGRGILFESSELGWANLAFVSIRQNFKANFLGTLCGKQ